MPDVSSGGLPRPLTSFIGRERELAQARRLLAGSCLVTLTGPGGSGKTRLGIALAAGRGHLALDAIVVAPRYQARAELLEPLGLKPAEVMMGEHPVGTRIEADRTGLTAVPGVWVAGNLTDRQAQLIAAAAGGLMAGAAINFDLVLEEARLARSTGT